MTGRMDPTPGLAGIHHVTLSVSDLDATLAWYRKVLGFEPVMSAEVDGMRKALLTRDGIRVSFVERRPGRARAIHRVQGRPRPPQLRGRGTRRT